MTVWIYARTADPDSNTLTGQAQDLADYAARHGWQVAGFTLDHGRGGSLLRPPLWAMLWKLRSGKADAVLVRSLSRIGYSYEFIYLVLCCLQDCGIRLRTAEQHLQLELYFIGLEHRLANRAVLKGRCVPWR